MKSTKDFHKEWEERRARIVADLMSFVRQSDSPRIMQEQYAAICTIANEVYDIQPIEDGWAVEFVAGTNIAHACEIAWALQGHTKLNVQFPFNGALISMTARKE